VLIVCERSGVWAAALARSLDSAIRVRQTRSLAECLDELRAAPASLMMLELVPENIAGVLCLLESLERRFPMARAAVVADRSLGHHDALLREAGAVHFTTSPRQMPLLARLAQRHASRTPRVPVPLAVRVWSSLPWGDTSAETSENGLTRAD
jgi:hypothetical protein